MSPLGWVAVAWLAISPVAGILIGRRLRGRSPGPDSLQAHADEAIALTKPRGCPYCGGIWCHPWCEFAKDTGQ